MPRGDYYEPTPLDFRVLEVLPDDGTIGGLRWKGRRARDVREQINERLRIEAANGGAMWINFYRALVELWNYRRQEKSMIRWKTIGGIQTLGETGAPGRSFTGRGTGSGHGGSS